MNLRCPIRTIALGILLAAAASAEPAIRLKVTAEIANIRQKPSISSLIVRQIPEGALLEASRKDGEWYLVALEPDETGTTSGYVHESLVLPLGEQAAPEKRTRIVERVTAPRPKPAETAPASIKDETPAAQRQTPPPPAYAAEVETPAVAPLRFSLVINAGLFSSAIDDLDDGAQGLADYYGYQLGASADLSVTPFRLVFPFEAEARIPIGGRFALTIGAGFVSASKTSLVTYDTTGSTSTFETTPGFSVIPVKVGILYSPVPYFYAKAGVMVVRAKATYDYHFVHDSFWADWTGEATAYGFGAFGALGVEVPLGSSFAFILEAGGQFGKVSGFEGTNTYIDSDLKTSTKESGTLYSYELKPTSLDSFFLVFIRSKKPTEGGVANARVAALNLLGFGLKAGLKLKF
ncbi:MAG: SH3 domain-containing protein [Acidobacteriota bacterium]|nr:SH3 domain-containing protein [Acidobacteriota bacterium]